jgi:NAD(P)-dependent dehydrogenase (short-subunit alcohol dehydrogenase family)
MTTRLDGKVVIITGSGGGLGRDFARAMAAAGAKVVVNDIGASLEGAGFDDSPAQRVVAEIISAGGEAVADNHSVAEWDSAHAVVQAAIDSFGRVDAVVNNAGILRDRMFFSMSEEEWRAVIDVHLHGTFFVSRAAAPHFRSQKSGSFIHVTSTTGLIGNVGQTNYGAAKMGIVGLSHNIALDMRRYGVTSNCIAPFAWTRMTSSLPQETPEEKDRVEKIQRMEGAKVAPLAVYLSSESGTEVNGQVFCVRANEIFLFSQPRPVRGMHTAEGWTPESIAEHLIPSLSASFVPVEPSSEVFTWDPV